MWAVVGKWELGVGEIGRRPWQRLGFGDVSERGLMVGAGLEGG